MRSDIKQKFKKFKNEEPISREIETKTKNEL